MALIQNHNFGAIANSSLIRTSPLKVTQFPRLKPYTHLKLLAQYAKYVKGLQTIFYYCFEI